jgi:hypothetical protein
VGPVLEHGLVLAIGPSDSVDEPRMGWLSTVITSDSSRNHWLLGVVTFGEYHNNHHAFPWSATQSFAWWEPDLGYWILKLWAAMGLVWDLKAAEPDADEHRVVEWTA